ncbi:ArnT family glycosyltransferase [Undibacterium curvum]|uniref:Glycosyltransferase family 39 protein n=1 Tax=Undibacterium curvum TaxID=2762294 RepID=A0ABR7A2F5_9BURK|nr:glycosyltransferase family 39 protein [Undibacterium curvum]MBC3931073.1 glycosyltransferase family 39 protein [Undibacterium curvum]
MMAESDARWSPAVWIHTGVSGVYRSLTNMRFMRLERGAVLVLMLGMVYLFPGLVGHDPWKQDEAYIFGIIQHMVETGDWIVPTMAGEPFMEKPPLYYWLASVLAISFSPLLPLHDGARLATGVFMLITCWATAWTSQQWWGRQHGRFAVFALLGCIGLILHSHMMLTDVPLLTGFAVAMAGFVQPEKFPLRSGCLLGTGIGIGFMAKGVLGLAIFGSTTILLPLLFANWRHRNYLKALCFAFLFALPWMLIWPLALYLRSYQLFMDWFWLNNVGRFFGFSVAQLGAPHTYAFWRTTLPWFLFPAWPLALLTLWRYRLQWKNSAALQCCMLVAGLMMLVLWKSASARDNYALPLILPFALLAAPAAASLSQRWDSLLSWSARIVFTSVAIGLWWIWGVMLAEGKPPAWAWLIRMLPEDFSPVFSWSSALTAVILTSACLYMVIATRGSRGRGLTNWMAGVSVCWMLLVSLLLPWVDHAKSYRSVFAEMETVLPERFDCMASKDLGESERAMLRYFSGIITSRQEVRPDHQCDLLLVNGLNAIKPAELLTHPEWQLVWEGARPGDQRERLWLFASRKIHHQFAAIDRHQALR